MKQISTSIQVINIKDKLKLFHDYWNPKIVGQLNNHEIKVAKLKGEFVWHHHDSVDELFWVIKGQLIIHFRDRKIIVNEGEFLIVPKKLEHKPEATKETHIVLIETKGTVNTGNIKTKLTRKKLQKIY